VQHQSFAAGRDGSRQGSFELAAVARRPPRRDLGPRGQVRRQGRQTLETRREGTPLTGVSNTM